MYPLYVPYTLICGLHSVLRPDVPVAAGPGGSAGSVGVRGHTAVRYAGDQKLPPEPRPCQPW
eukprot:606289-Pyramimonas_sp.AAC.2